MGAVHHDDFTEQMFKQVPEGMYLRTRAVQYSDDVMEREYMLFARDTHEKWISFRARRLPGCCGVLVVFYLRPTEHAKKGKEVFMDTFFRIKTAAGLAKLGSVLLTQTKGSLGQELLSKSSLGHMEFSFVNWKTDNEIVGYSFNTTPPPKPAPVRKFDDEWSH